MNTQPTWLQLDYSQLRYRGVVENDVIWTTHNIDRKTFKKLKKIFTLKTLRASSQTCMPRDSKTSTHPRYLTGKVQVPARTAASSACHWCGRADSGGEPLRRLNDSRKERRRRSMPARGGDSAAPARARLKELRTEDFWNYKINCFISCIYM